MTIQCVGCGRDFLYFPRKRYHNEPCRKRHARLLKIQQDQALWSAGTSPEFPTSMEKSSPEELLKTFLLEMEKTGAHYYRVGCPQNGVSSGELRWFPLAGHDVSPFLLINPFSMPMVPFPGTYLLAFFSADKRLLGSPTWKLPINNFNLALAWSSGTQKP